jgi:SAM-dependent methyltransferase
MPLSDDALRKRLARQPWTAQNIRLSDQVTTMPGKPDFLETDIRLQGMLRALAPIYGGRLDGVRVADLGCLEGGFALALARRGADVLGVEAREANLEKTALLKEHFELPNLNFVQADVKQFTTAAFGTFDIVLALGILYHLDDPVRWLRQIAESTRALLIVDSHLAPLDDAGVREVDPSIARLGALERMDVDGRSYEGRWFREVTLGTDRERQLWAAYSNDFSFWLTKEAMVVALHQAGFDLLFEQQDWIADQYKVFTTKLVRAMFVAAKTPAFLAKP